MKKNHKRFSEILLAALAEGEEGSGGGNAGAPATGTDSGVTPDDKQMASSSSSTGKQQASSRDQSGQRDAATDDTKGDTKGDQKPGGDTSRLEKALDKERELRKAAEKTATDRQAEVEKATKAQQEQLDALGKALGFKKDDAPPDPEALQRAVSERDARLTEVQAEKDREVAARDDTIRQQRVELAAWRLATDPKLGANVGALLDSRRVADSIKDMDPAGETFEKDLAALLKTTVDGNEAYRINRAAAAASDAGIGASGAKNNDAHVTPGAGRLRAAYSST